eukprot:scaffold23863_cov33-Phaeocystis_antarctica.AAC.2
MAKLAVATLTMATLTLAAAHALPSGPARRAYSRAHQLARLRSWLARRAGSHPTAGAQASSAKCLCMCTARACARALTCACAGARHPRSALTRATHTTGGARL